MIYSTTLTWHMDDADVGLYNTEVLGHNPTLLSTNEPTMPSRDRTLDEPDGKKGNCE